MPALLCQRRPKIFLVILNGIVANFYISVHGDYDLLAVELAL